MSRQPSLLRFIDTQLASSVDQPPEGKNWIHEIKHDGSRSLVLIQGGEVRVYTRNGHDWSDRFPGIVRAASNLPCKSAIIDGEVIVQDKSGASTFEALASAIQSRSNSIILCAFDLLHLNGQDLRRQTLLECVLVGVMLLPLMSVTPASATPREIQYFCYEQVQQATLPLRRGAWEAFMANCIANLTPTPTKKRNYRK